jgi:FO synthase
MSAAAALLDRAAAGHAPSSDEAMALAECDDLAALMEVAAALRDHGHGPRVSYSRKVFIPLTRLCRDSCRYCTFAHPPRRDAAAYLTPEEVLAIARAGAQASCKEALFTLGDKPELRYRAARTELARLGHDSTISYLAAMAGLVLRETGLLPHVNPGVMAERDLAALREVSVSMGLMLETVSERLLAPGGAHDDAPDKVPARRLRTIELAGKLAIPFTTGILIGIGETPRERVDALLAIRDLHERYGHVQEVIVQNFRAKPRIPMRDAPEPSLDELRRTVAVARLVLGPEVNIQAPPNLSPGGYAALLGAGLNDWGGVSPLTPDHINPERPWPGLAALRTATEAAGFTLRERLAIYPEYVRRAEFLDEALRARAASFVGDDGLVKESHEHWRRW